MDRVKIKQQAKSMIKGNIFNLIIPFIIAGILTSAISCACSYIFYSEESAFGIMSLIANGLSFPLSLGAIAYVMKFVRKENVDLNYMFSFYKKILPIFALFFLVGLFTIFWSFLFIIPGIIAAISYSMSTYLFIDGEENAMNCIKKSKNMMNGYKADYFIFNFSFFGWFVLSIITMGIALIYVVPYLQVSQILYYEELKKIK